MQRITHRPSGARRGLVRAAAGIAVVATALAALAAPAVAAVRPAVARGVVPGPTRKPLVVDDRIELSGYDLAIDSAGTAYLGWISAHSSSNDDRTVHLCVLPKEARACSGGVQSTDSLGTSSAAGLRVLVTSAGHATLVWFHDTNASVNTPDGGRIATATFQHGGSLSDATDQTHAPSFGGLLTAAMGPGGSIWLVTQNSTGTGQHIQVHPGLTAAPHTLTAKFLVGDAWLAFAGTKPVLAIDQYGSITQPVSYATENGTTWSTFKKVAHTWSVGGAIGLVGTRSGVRLVASVDEAGYFPVVARWTGSGFSAPKPDGDTNSCAPSTHDLVTDASGRVADVSNECDKIAVANLANTTTAGIVRFSAGGAVAGGRPQIASTPRGVAWVAWAVESSVANKLEVVPVLLPALASSAATSSPAGKVTVSGPARCLPPVTAAVKVTGRPASGWHVGATSLKLAGTTVHGTINGASIPPGASRALVGSVTFTHSGQASKVVKATLTVVGCPLP